MIREELKQLRTAEGELRKFGLLVGCVFVLLAAWFWLRGRPVYPYLLFAAAALMLFGAVFPRGLRWVYVGWMALAFTLGLAVSTLLLTLFYYLVVTPIGLLARLVGKDFMNRRLDHSSKSYWIIRDRSIRRKKEDYEQQF